MIELVERYARLDYPVWIDGERGTGKSLAAWWLHRLSGRSGRFLSYSMAALSARDGREIGDLFGWVRGAFTGAYSDRPGILEQAHRGTAFLDEIALASLRVQELLLAALEQKVVVREGDCRPRPIDTRIIVATNVDLEQAVRAGTFRADLLDRLMLFRITIPPLRDRLGDLLEIGLTFLAAEAARIRRPARDLEPVEIDRLMAHQWPGNVRELENVMAYFLVHGQLPDYLPTTSTPGQGWQLPTVESVIGQCGGNMSEAARRLGISRTALYKRLGSDRVRQFRQRGVNL